MYCTCIICFKRAFEVGPIVRTCRERVANIVTRPRRVVLAFAAFVGRNGYDVGGAFGAYKSPAR